MYFASVQRTKSPIFLDSCELIPKSRRPQCIASKRHLNLETSPPLGTVRKTTCLLMVCEGCSIPSPLCPISPCGPKKSSVLFFFGGGGPLSRGITPGFALAVGSCAFGIPLPSERDWTLFATGKPATCPADPVLDI
eukprot:CAMPEP_0184560386 /NCGR_PEP_ID=MMETSP0199_2-20130426/46910_1 /TAXON_ID=1112570 /ORGANISM="Thraustochytrium sp., Strain LLF1b" /LENGTH=135 /DNA_ID=CAMNT_0026957687 /DNA_START=161 /DNA_END=568 /DNA_ORIENTATION=-